MLRSPGDNSPGRQESHIPYGKPVPVRLLLDDLFPHPADAPQTSIPDGWDLTGPVPALAMAATWIRSARGMWLCECRFDLRSADGRRTLPVRGHLVPAHLIRVID